MIAHLESANAFCPFCPGREGGLLFHAITIHDRPEGNRSITRSRLSFALVTLRVYPPFNAPLLLAKPTKNRQGINIFESIVSFFISLSSNLNFDRKKKKKKNDKIRYNNNKGEFFSIRN